MQSVGQGLAVALAPTAAVSGQGTGVPWFAVSPAESQQLLTTFSATLAAEHLDTPETRVGLAVYPTVPSSARALREMGTAFDAVDVAPHLLAGLYELGAGGLALGTLGELTSHPAPTAGTFSALGNLAAQEVTAQYQAAGQAASADAALWNTVACGGTTPAYVVATGQELVLTATNLSSAPSGVLTDHPAHRGTDVSRQQCRVFCCHRWRPPSARPFGPCAGLLAAPSGKPARHHRGQRHRTGGVPNRHHHGVGLWQSHPLSRDGQPPAHLGCHRQLGYRVESLGPRGSVLGTVFRLGDGEHFPVVQRQDRAVGLRRLLRRAMGMFTRSWFTCGTPTRHGLPNGRLPRPRQPCAQVRRRRGRPSPASPLPPARRERSWCCPGRGWPQ